MGITMDCPRTRRITHSTASEDEALKLIDLNNIRNQVRIFVAYKIEVALLLVTAMVTNWSLPSLSLLLTALYLDSELYILHLSKNWENSACRIASSAR